MVTKKKVIPLIPADCMPMCSTCKFSEFINSTDDAGFCHANPPVSVQEGDNYSFTFVVINRDNWCRLYERRSN